VTARLPTALPVRLPVHRVAGGRLAGDFVELSDAGSGSGRPVTVVVPEDAEQEVRLGTSTIPAGCYGASFWPDLTGAVLVLRPDDGSPPIMLAWPDDFDREGTEVP
jgi:hypothetical protein